MYSTFFKPLSVDSLLNSLFICVLEWNLFLFCASQIKTVTLFPGDGIGPEISTAVMRIFEAAKVSSGRD